MKESKEKIKGSVKQNINLEVFMVIRLATKNDIEIIVKLRLKMLQDYEENLPQELSGAIQNYLEKHINDNSCICSLAEIDGTIVSMAMLGRKLEAVK